MVEVTIDSVETSSSSENKFKGGWWVMMGDSGDGGRFPSIFTGENSVNFTIFLGETVIDIVPITIYLSNIKVKIFTDVGFLVTRIISTSVISWSFKFLFVPFLEVET